MGWIKKRAAFASVSGLRYRVGIVSDVHAGYSNYGFETNFAVALNNLHALGAAFIVGCGDCANGNTSYWDSYVSVIDASPYERAQIYETVGNHEYDGTDQATAWERFNNYTNPDNTTGKPWYSTMVNGDAFIFLVIENGSPATSDCFSTEQLDWFEAQLAEHYGKGYNVWVMEHAPFHGWGSGDIMSNPTYPRGMNMSFTGHLRLQQILIDHPDIIMCHGHTHIRFEDRDNFGVTIYAPPEDGGCHQIHVPAITALKKINSASSEPGVIGGAGYSQCWIADVYPDKVVFTGLNAYTGEAIPNMVYTIER